MVVVGLVIAAFALQSVSLGVAALTAFHLGMPCLAIWAAKSEERIAAAELRAFNDAEDLDLCFVEVEIVVNWQSVGKDRGVIWFANDMLFFSGVRTSFALGGQDVLPKELHTMTHRGDNLRYTLPLKTGKPRVSVKLKVIRRKEDGDLRLTRFRLNMESFRERPGLVRGELRQWPPTSRVTSHSENQTR